MDNEATSQGLEGGVKDEVVTSTTTSTARTLTIAKTATVQVLGGKSKLLPIRLPIQVVNPTSGTAPIPQVPPLGGLIVANIQKQPALSSSSPAGSPGKQVSVATVRSSGLLAAATSGKPLILTTAKAAAAVGGTDPDNKSGAKPISAIALKLSSPNPSSSSSTPNILRSNSAQATLAAKNSIERQAVSHEATIELRKNQPGILAKSQQKPVPMKPTVEQEQRTPPVRQEIDELEPVAILDDEKKDSLELPAIHVTNGPDVEVKEEAESVDLLKPLEEDVDEIKVKVDEEIVDDNEDDVDDLDDLRCKENEFGAIELSTSNDKSDEDSDESGSIDLTCKEVPPPSPRKDGNGPRIRDDEILCCDGCGCYGMAGEFYNTEACSSACQTRIVQKVREREKKERELAVQKQRREQRKKEREAKDAEEKKARDVLDREERKRMMAEENAKRSTTTTHDQVHNVARPEDELPQEKQLPFTTPHAWLDQKRGFTWSRYLECTNSRAAPSKLFADPYPPTHNQFNVGMKLEAIDPDHPALICVVTVSEVQGYRLRLHFDGYSAAYDFWENANSSNLFPAGWCEAHRQRLTSSPTQKLFNWKAYLEETNSVAAPKEHFRERTKVQDLNGWKAGFKLEAVDRQNTSLVCVATVTNVMDGRVLVHFDGWEIDYDYWVTPSSPYIHHKGWCQENGIVLNPPKGYRNEFNWDRYLEETRSRPVPQWAFKPPRSDVSLFRKGMKLEAVDRHNPIFVRVATVVDVLMHQIKLHFDGWPEEYDFWCEDASTDLHPQSWCSRTGHTLMPPITQEEVQYYLTSRGCPTPGCRGIGHIQGARFPSHDSIAACPYAPQNLHAEPVLADRINGCLKNYVEKDLTDETWPPGHLHQSKRSSLNRRSQVDPELGRGNRKRKRRKFFDDEEDRNNSRPHMAKRFHQGVNYRQAVQDDLIRANVFRPGYVPNPGGNSKALSWKENVDFLKVPVKDLSLTQVSQWQAKQVAGFVSTLPGVGNSSTNGDSQTNESNGDDKSSTRSPEVLGNLASRIIEEEIDGEAFLLLTQADLVKLLGLKLGPAIKLYNAILLIKANHKKSPALCELAVN